MTKRYAEECAATREILDRVGDKWSVFVIVSLSEGPVRFSRLKREIDGISQRMLTLTLRGLERDGLVRRTVSPTVPPRVDYSLTKLGRTVIKLVMELASWAHTHRTEVERARHKFDAQLAKTEVNAALRG